MKLLTFKYTKKDNSVSDRTLLVTTKPDTMYEGIDISELEAPEQVMFLDAVNAAHVSYLEALNVIKTEFDVVHNYRRFDPFKMTNIVHETV